MILQESVHPTHAFNPFPELDRFIVMNSTQLFWLFLLFLAALFMYRFFKRVIQG